MRKFLVSAVILLCVITVILCAFSGIQQVYVITEKSCYSLFGCSSKEFLELELYIYDEVGDFRKKATVNKDGSLLISLTKKQKEALSEYLLADPKKGISETKIEVSQDYSIVTAFCFKETKNTDISNAFSVLERIFFAKYLLGNVDNVKFTVELKDGVSEETVVTWICEGKDLSNSTFEAEGEFNSIQDIGKLKRTEYTVSPYLCRVFSGYSPEDFVEKEGSTYLYKDSYVDEKGNLILSFDQAQANYIIESMDTIFDERLKNPRINISSDYAKIEIYGYRETYEQDINSLASTASLFILKQILNGVPSDNVGIEVIVKDGATGEVKAHISNWIIQTIPIINANDFSSIRENVPNPGC